MDNTEKKWTIQKAEKAIDKHLLKKKKAEEELKEIEDELSNAKKVRAELLKEKTMQTLSKVIFSDKNLTEKNIDKILSLVSAVGENIDNIDVSELSEFIKTKNDKLSDSEKKPDTNINFSNGEEK